MASCTYVSHVHAINGAWAAANGSAYTGSTGDSYYTTKITFETPTFSGITDNITFHLAMAKVDAANTSDVTLRYAICSSDANKASYCNTYSAVSDANQLVTGTAKISGLKTTVDYYDISVNTSKLSSGKTYYLFLWASTSKSNPTFLVIQPTAAVNHTISITVNKGLVYIDNGTSFEAYQVYIDNGSGWDLYIPYIDNGSSWDMYG